MRIVLKIKSIEGEREVLIPLRDIPERPKEGDGIFVCKLIDIKTANSFNIPAKVWARIKHVLFVIVTGREYIWSSDEYGTFLGVECDIAYEEEFSPPEPVPTSSTP